MEKKWTIRETKRSDAQAIIALIFVGWLDTYVNNDLGITSELILSMKLPNLEYPFFRDKFQYDVIENNMNNLHLVAEDKNGVVVGVVHGRRDEDSQSLEGLYVYKELHGTGLAHELVSKFDEWEDKGRDSIVHTVAYNDRAIRFYEKVGFVDSGEKDKVRDIIPCIYMVKKNVKEKEK